MNITKFIFVTFPQKNIPEATIDTVQYRFENSSFSHEKLVKLTDPLNCFSNNSTEQDTYQVPVWSINYSTFGDF